MKRLAYLVSVHPTTFVVFGSFSVALEWAISKLCTSVHDNVTGANPAVARQRLARDEAHELTATFHGVVIKRVTIAKMKVHSETCNNVKTTTIYLNKD